MKLRKRFALRLYSVMCERFGDDAPFERLKRELVRGKLKTRESTVRNWLPPLTRLAVVRDGAAVRDGDWRVLRAPDVASLEEVARLLDVSVDYLLGADVPRRLSDRVPLENPAPALLAHVIRDYLRRSKRERRDGLAAAVGGRLTEREPTPDNPDYLAEVAELQAEATAKKRPFISPRRPFRDWPQPGDTLPDGRIVTNRSVFGLQLLEADTQAFLASICDRVFADAEQWEEDHKEAERNAVREHVNLLEADAVEIAQAMVEGTGEPTTEADVLRRLLHASLIPLNARAQTQVITMREQLASYRRRKEQQRQTERDLGNVIKGFLAEAFGPDELSDETEDRRGGTAPGEHSYEPGV